MPVTTQEPTAPPMEIDPYTPLMPRPISKPRPKQGHRLATLRKAAGLSQTELAKAIGVSQQTVAYWETCAAPPRSDVLPKMAKALGVRVEEILGDKPVNAVRKPGPVGKLQRVFEQATTLPRKEQDIVASFVETLIERSQRKAS
jgi:transcriptional regulator with XRE-family HTH domain